MGQIEGQGSAALSMEKALEEYDRIVLIDRSLGDQQLLDAFSDGESFKGADRKTLILWERADRKAGSIEWRHVAEEEAEGILRLYHLYEFSNRIAIVARGQAFGSLLDYVATGLLTREEMAAAILR